MQCFFNWILLRNTKTSYRSNYYRHIAWFHIHLDEFIEAIFRQGICFIQCRRVYEIYFSTFASYSRDVSLFLFSFLFFCSCDDTFSDCVCVCVVLLLAGSVTLEMQHNQSGKHKTRDKATGEKNINYQRLLCVCGFFKDAEFCSKPYSKFNYILISIRGGFLCVPQRIHFFALFIFFLLLCPAATRFVCIPWNSFVCLANWWIRLATFVHLSHRSTQCFANRVCQRYGGKIWWIVMEMNRYRNRTGYTLVLLNSVRQRG